MADKSFTIQGAAGIAEIEEAFEEDSDGEILAVDIQLLPFQRIY